MPFVSRWIKACVPMVDKDFCFEKSGEEGKVTETSTAENTTATARKDSIILICPFWLNTVAQSSPFCDDFVEGRIYGHNLTVHCDSGSCNAIIKICSDLNRNLWIGHPLSERC